MSSSARQHARELAWRRLVILPILLLVGFQFLEAHMSAGKRVGFVMGTKDAEVPGAVLEVLSGGPADLAGIRVDDRLQSVGGLDALEYDQAAKSFERGEAVEFRVLRGQESLALQVIPGMATDWTRPVLSALVVLLYVAMALLTIDRRPGSLPSRLLYWFFILLAVELSLPSMGMMIGTPILQILSDSVLYLVVGLEFGMEFHLVSLIPRRPDWLRRHPWWVPALYVVGLAIGVLVSFTLLIESYVSSDVLPWSHRSVFEFMYGDWLIFFSTLLILMLGYRTFSHPGYRGRLQAGIVLLGILPWAIHIYTSEIFTRMGRSLPLVVDDYLGLFALAPYPVSIFVMLRLEDSARNRVLRNLIEEVQEAGSIKKISELISEKLNLAFYTKCNYVFFRDSRNSELTSTHSSGSDIDMERIPSDYKILEIADRKGDTLSYPDDITEPLPAVEKEWLDCLQASLIVPLVESEEHMMGLLILGQKRSEEPYTPDDLELLHSLARQIAVAHENVALQLRVQERERVQRQVLERLEGQEIFLVKECSACGFCFDSTEETCPRDGAELALTLPVERFIDGHYRLEQVLGRGGAAVVYLATDVRLNRGVAVKVLALSLLDDVVAPRRFEREARVSAQLRHPNIVTTHDFGKTKNGLPYLVMEFLEGRTLRQSLKKKGSFDGPIAAELFGQVLDGLGAAHALGVVHRDLKPDNAFIVRGQLDGEGEVVKLLDFGLAKIATRKRDESFTSPGTIMGTLSYMAPEQLQGREVDRRADLYAVGVMAYEAVTGKRPFEGRGPAQILTAILRGTFDFPDLPGARPLLAVLERCFEQDPKRRYGSAAELRKELIPALEGCPRLASVESAA